MVLEWDYICACPHIIECYATGNSCGVLEELVFGSVEVMKTLSVHGPARWDKRQFRAKTTVSTWTNLELMLLNQRITKMVLSLLHMFAFSCDLCTWPSSLSAFMIRKTHRIYLLGWISFYRFCGQVMLIWLKCCIYCASAPSLHWLNKLLQILWSSYADLA